MKSYRLIRDCYGPAVICEDDTRNPHHYTVQHVVRHSPTGLNWGYGGSGPADCALSILTDCVGEERAERWYQNFKWVFIAQISAEGGVITEESIRAFIEVKEAEYAETYSR